MWLVAFPLSSASPRLYSRAALGTHRTPACPAPTHPQCPARPKRPPLPEAKEPPTPFCEAFQSFFSRVKALWRLGKAMDWKASTQPKREWLGQETEVGPPVLGSFWRLPSDWYTQGTQGFFPILFSEELTLDLGSQVSAGFGELKNLFLPRVSA